MNLSWKEIKHNKGKFILIEAIIILLIFMVVFLSGLANGLARAVSSGIENTNASYFVVNEDSKDLITGSQLETSSLLEVENEAKGEVASLNILRTSLNMKGSESKYDITYFAIDSNGFLNPEVNSGDDLNANNQIVLDKSYEDDNVVIGDVVEDSKTGIEMEVVGFTSDRTYGHIAVGYITVDTYNEILKEINPNYIPYFNAIAIKDNDLIQLDSSTLKVTNKNTIVENIPGYASEQNTIILILWVLVIVSGAILGVFFYVLTIQKLKQFGVLKAIGMKMSEITRLLVSQILLLGVSGVVIGNAISYGLAALLPDSMPFYLKSIDVLIVSLVFILISILFSLLSIQKVSKVDPIIMIGESE